MSEKAVILSGFIRFGLEGGLVFVIQMNLLNFLVLFEIIMPQLRTHRDVLQMHFERVERLGAEGSDPA